MRYVELGIRCMIGTVFLVSSMSKVVGRGAFGEFAASVRRLRFPLVRRARPAAVVVIVAEFAVCVLLAAGPVIAGYALAMVLLAGFTVAIAHALGHGVRASCRCFGASTAPLSRRHLARNAVLGLMAAAGAVTPPGLAEIRPGGLVVALLGGLMLGGLVVVLDDLIDLFRPMPTTVTRPRHAEVRTHPAALVESTMSRIH